MKFSPPPRYLVVLSVLGVLLSVIDFLFRVYVPMDRSSRRFAEPVLTPLASVGASVDDVRRSLDEWFPQVSAEASKAPNEVLLQGVFRKLGQPPRVALVVRSGEGQVIDRRLVGAGETVDGWKVDRIDRERVVLSKDALGKEMVLFQHGLESKN
jgi:hypothetical protein